MRFSKFVVVASALAFVACGGGEKKPEAAPAQTPAPAPAATAAPITGKTHVVQMVGDANGARFDPKTITIKAGDGIRFDVVSLPPHNVAFDPAKLSPEAKAALVANMPEQALGELSGKLLNAPGESYTVSFANVPPGTYEAFCTPHLAMNMRITIIVQ